MRVKDKQFFQFVKGRDRPEDVAAYLLETLEGRLLPDEATILQKAARGRSWSSMPAEFCRPVNTLDRQLTVGCGLFPAVELPDKNEPDEMLAYIDQAGATIKRKLGDSDFKHNRLDRDGRKLAGFGNLSRRQYNKRFRLLAHMEKKANKVGREWTKANLAQFAKSRMACKLSRNDFERDVDTAAFVAYMTATLNRRSLFTNKSQVNAYDNVADMLLKRLRGNRTTNWFAVAHVLPDAEIIARLNQKQKGQLLGLWRAALESAAQILKEVNAACTINRQTMVVKRGNDSSTWNAAAGAWNKARDGYIAVLTALDMDEVLEWQCLGKVPRLMAGDVTAWHCMSGDDVSHPDVKVWASLPAPWEVLSGETTCTRQAVEAACRRHGVDPEKTGWTAPRSGRQAGSFTPTPELVHGVAVSSPGLASLLKKAGWFSGKSAKKVVSASRSSSAVERAAR